MRLDIDKYTLLLSDWHTPATDYPEKQIGDYRIHHTHYTHGVYEMSGVDNFIFFKVVKSLPITRLQQRIGKHWYPWMVDDPPHWGAMKIYAEHSKGKVLAAGLGLGLYFQALKGNRNVESITVLERSKEVIQLVEPYLPILPGFAIVVDDFFNFVRSDNTQWDTILVDLWVTHGEEEKLDIFLHNVIPTAVMLRQKYPNASITFHGFYSVSDIPFASREMVDLILDMKNVLGQWKGGK